MPWSLKHFQQSGQNHYLTFSCYHRQPKLGTPASRDLFIRALEKVRQQYELLVYGFVVMPEHVHLLVGEPQKGQLAQALQSLTQSVARRLALRAAEPFWQARYYDFDVWSERKFTEKLRYIHRNPVTQGLVGRPEDWLWSSSRHYLTGEACGVEIESRWAASTGFRSTSKAAGGGARAALTLSSVRGPNLKGRIPLHLPKLRQALTRPRHASIPRARLVNNL